MAKYRDKTKTQLPAEICKYKRDERSGDRHNRRLETNKQYADKLRNYCRSNGLSFEIKNEGLHWQIKRGEVTIDWWPSTAKMVVNQQYDQGIHVHDITQIKSYLNFAKLILNTDETKSKECQKCQHIKSKQ